MAKQAGRVLTLGDLTVIDGNSHLSTDPETLAEYIPETNAARRILDNASNVFTNTRATPAFPND